MKAKNADRVDLRVPAPVKERLRKVAALTGRSMSDFIVAAALEKADEVSASIGRWELDTADSRAVVDVNAHDHVGLRALFAENPVSNAAEKLEA